MKRHLCLLCLLLSACAGLPANFGNAPTVQLSYQQVSSDIASYRESPVRWGGVIIDVDNEDQVSLMHSGYIAKVCRQSRTGTQ